MNKLVILDRDGVINHDSDDYIKSPEEWVPIPGSLEAIARLHREGYKVIVATNQSGVGRGLFDMDTLGRIHARMLEAVRAKGGEIDAIFFCPHKPEDNCGCRKPQPGLFQEIAERLKVNLNGVYAVGRHRARRRGGAPGVGAAGAGAHRQGQAHPQEKQGARGYPGVRGSCRHSPTRFLTGKLPAN